MVLLRKADPNASSEEGMCLCPTTGTMCLNFKPAFYTRPLVSCVSHRGHTTTDWVSYTCTVCGMHLFLHGEINYMAVPRSTVHIHITASDWQLRLWLSNYLANYAMTTFSAQLIQLQHQDKSNFSKSKDDGALGSWEDLEQLCFGFDKTRHRDVSLHHVSISSALKAPRKIVKNPAESSISASSYWSQREKPKCPQSLWRHNYTKNIWTTILLSLTRFWEPQQSTRSSLISLSLSSGWMLLESATNPLSLHQWSNSCLTSAIKLHQHTKSTLLANYCTASENREEKKFRR